MKKKTYKQWVDFHLKNLKKQYPNRSDAVLMMMAGDMARESIKKQGGLPAATLGQSATEPVLGPRVGPEASSQPVPSPTPTPTKPPIEKRPSALTPSVPTPEPVTMSYNDRVVARIKARGSAALDGINTSGGLEWVDFLKTLSKDDYPKIQAALKKLGYNVKNINQINTILSGEFANLFPNARVKDVNSLIAELNKFALPGAGDEAKLPLRQISPVDRGTLVSFARSIVEDTLMMERLTPEMENKIVDDWMKKAEKGVVTMPTKKVRNPKTGKLENVVETKRAFDQQTEGLALADRLKQMFPDQYELAQGIGFAAEMKKILAGGQ